MASKEIASSCFVSVNREITESIRKAIDRSSIKFARGIKLDTKSGKSEDRILVLTTWRIYLLAAKVPAKVEITFNFLEIRAMTSHPELQVVIETDKSAYSLRLQSREHLDHVINHVNFALSRIFNNSVFAPSVCHSEGDASEGSRKVSPSSETSVETQRACGGFSETYAALCDYNGISCKEEVQWDVDTIYHSQDNREFNLLDFSHLESRDLAVIVASMAYNTWFTKLYCKDLRIGSEVMDQILHTLSKSSSLEEVTLENTGLRSDFPQKMALALSENPASVIHSLNLAHNTLDNQGVSSLVQQVCRLSKGLRLLNLSKTSLSAKGVVSLAQALCSSDDYSNSLLHLDLSRNPGALSGDDSTNLCLFLSQPNCLVHLDLSGTDCAVESLFGALLRGCCADLSYLNLSKNSFSHKKMKETLPMFRQFFSSAFSLTHISLASMKLPPDALRALFLGLSSNPHINDLHLDISGCELRSTGAVVLEECLPRLSSIATLDISDNGLDADLLSVLPALSRHPSIKHLLLGKNFNIKNRVLDEVLQKLVQLIQEEECVLQSLSVADSRLRSRGTVLVNALGSNACLRRVDLSGNNMEDVGAKMLSKALQINTTLRSVTWDRNNTTATGFWDVARALEHNFTLQYMPLPLSDVTQAYRNTPEKTEQALVKIQRALLRNNQTQRFSQRQALRLHQGLVTSTAEQVMERLCVRVQQQVSVLRGVGDGEELKAAKQVLKEARNSRALYPSLCELAHVLSVDGPVRQKLDSLAGELAKAADKELQVIVDSMVVACRELCLLLSAAERLTPPLSSVSERVSIPRSTIRSALMERAAQDIHRALEEVKLSVVSYLTNSIVDHILQDLYATQKALTRQVSQVKHWEAAGEGGTGRRAHRHRDSLDITDEELGTSIDTIAIKKRSSRTRRIRPVSTRLSLCDDSSSSPPASAPPLSAPLSRSASWECLSTLPTQGAPLHHVTRVRPRPPRRHRRAHAPVDPHCTENGAVTPLDDGLPDFYTKRVLPDSQLSCLHKAQSLRRKKRRNMLAIFSFRRNRNSIQANHGTESRGGGVASGEECRTMAMAPTGNATENVYTLLQPPRISGKAEPSREGPDGKVEDQRGEDQGGPAGVRPVQGIPLPGMGGQKPPSFSPRQKPEPDQEPYRQTDRQAGTDTHRLQQAEVGRQTVSTMQTDRQTVSTMQTERQTACTMQTDRQTVSTMQTDRQTVSTMQTDRQTVSTMQADRQTDRQTVSTMQIERLKAAVMWIDRQTASVDRQTVSADRQTDKQTVSADKQRELAERQTVSVDRQTVSADGQTTSADKQRVLAERQTVSVDRQTVSADRQTVSADKHTHRQTVSVDRQTVSVDGQTVSSDRQRVLAERQTVSADRQTDRQTVSADKHTHRQTVSVDGQTVSSDRQRVLAERQTVSADRQTDRQTVSADKHTHRQTVSVDGQTVSSDRQRVLAERQTVSVDRQTVSTDRQTDRRTISVDRQRVLAERQTVSVDRQTVSAIQSNRQTPPTVQPDRQTILTDRQTVSADRQTDRQTVSVDRQTDRQTVSADRQTDRQTVSADRQTDRQTVSVMPTAAVAHIDRQAVLYMQADRQTVSASIIQSNRQTVSIDRQTDRQAVSTIQSNRQTPPTMQPDRQTFLADRQTVSAMRTDRQTQGPPPLVERQAPPSAQTDRHTRPGGQTDRQMGGPPLEEKRRCRGGPEGGVPLGGKPDPPPQSTKPNLAKLRQRPLLDSPGPEEEGRTERERDMGRREKKDREEDVDRGRETEGRPPPIPEKKGSMQPNVSSSVTTPKDVSNERKIQPPAPPTSIKPVLGLVTGAVSQGEEVVRSTVPVKPLRNKKALSCDAGTSRDSLGTVERPPNRKPPVKKPRLPQNRNKSLDYPELCRHHLRHHQNHHHQQHNHQHHHHDHHRHHHHHLHHQHHPHHQCHHHHQQHHHQCHQNHHHHHQQHHQHHKHHHHHQLLFQQRQRGA
ncbi:capping protein, Arp2/3 and myosin-I linker protein 3-like [Anguilla rostrata]|uniref:capping protein, Arp2/3 and myosin-I linker protein 3-like n=1 Tax=Anguilla rostrata TaxID=7938 RepID=UPI0030D349FA